jgi:hypothetical protein
MKFDYPKHQSILLQILKEIYSDTALGPYLGFKGGTAAQLFYGLDRHSVDLDFDLLEENKETEVFEKIRNIIASYGRITESRPKHFSLLNVISYAPGAPQIKVEISRRNFGSQYTVKTLLGISMLVMVEADMFAHKMMAMVERIIKTSRDIFDVNFFQKNQWKINKTIVEGRSGMSFKETLEKGIALLEKLNNKNILDGLGELLSESQKDWARAKLKEETISLLRLSLEGLEKIDTLAPYTPTDLESIKSLLNEKFFRDTQFSCKELSIKKDKVFWEENGSEEESYGYQIECVFLQAGKEVRLHQIPPMNSKIEVEKVAHRIAFAVWGELDQSKTSQLWKNL